MHLCKCKMRIIKKIGLPRNVSTRAIANGEHKMFKTINGYRNIPPKEIILVSN